MRVISGKFRNVDVPFINDKFDDANTTPQMVKKALFTMLGEDLTGKSFLDLYACSGQIGIEALSRGANPVVMNELDKKRFQFIWTAAERFKTDDCLLLNFHSFRCLRYIESKKMTFDFIFADPPYPDPKDGADAYLRILDEISKYNALKPDGRIIMQHHEKVKLNNHPAFIYTGTKSYGRNSLSFFELK
jgi:16S rRNA (guanine966-N2)-methyltransferase